MERMENAHVATLLFQMADLLEIKGDSPFRIRAFRRVGQAVENLAEHVGAMLAAGTLIKEPGIGAGTVARIKEILETGSCADYDELLETMPDGLLEMMRVEGLGPKKVRLFYSELGISSIDALEAAAQQGHLASLPRMGEKSQAKILRAIEAYRRHTGRILLGDALPQAMSIIEVLRQLPPVLAIELAGSSRRGRETIGDLDLLVASEDSDRVMDAFTAFPRVQEVMLRGDTKCSVKLESNLQVDLRVVPPSCYGAALHYFTGSKMHNIAIRDRAKRRGLRISEYGVFKENTDQSIGGATEEEIFAAVELPYIPPELREDRGELEAAEAGELPALITLQDLRGDLHMHTNATDGSASAEAMARAAGKLGYQYIAITDHSQALGVAGGLDEARLRAQITALRRLQEAVTDLRILPGIEVDILPDGELDLPLSLLKELDFVIASVHSHFNLAADQMTARIIRAMESGVVDCLGHPTGRLLGQRDPYLVEMEQVLLRASQLEVAVELNAFPERLDLGAAHCRQAKELKIPVAINTDAHAPHHLTQRECGIATARRGWLEPADVLNAQPLANILQRRADRLS